MNNHEPRALSHRPSRALARRTHVRQNQLMRIVALIAVGSFAVLTGAGCALVDRFNHVSSKHFAERGDAPSSGDLAFKLPDLVPKDATDITVRVQTESGQRMYSWTSESKTLPGDCSTGDPSNTKPFDVDAWPGGVLEMAATACGKLPVHVRSAGSAFYAWW